MASRDEERRAERLRDHPFVTHIGQLRAELTPFLNDVCKGEENGLHAVAVVASDGCPHISDTAEQWEVKNRRDALDVVLYELKYFIADFHKRLKPRSIANIDEELLSLLQLHHIRLSMGEHYVSFENLDKEAFFFVVGISWRKKGYTGLTFTGPAESLRSCRDAIIGHLQDNYSDWFQTS